MTQVETADLWYRKGTGDEAARHELILMYRPLARRIAASVWRGTPSQVELDDLVSYAYMGLLRAVDNYNPDKGAAFETYAPVCIRGGILDEIRTMDWAPRSVRRKQRDVDKARVELESENNETPTISDIADRLGVTAAEVVATIRSTDRAKMKSIDELSVYSESDDNDGDVREWQPTTYDELDPTDHSLSRAVMRKVADSIRDASLQEQLVICLYYYERLTFRDLSAILGIAESRASQIHAKIIMSVQSAMHAAVAMRAVCPLCKTQLLPSDYDDEMNTYECPDCETEVPA